MKLIEIPDTIMVLSEDDAGVIELSADLGAEHYRREMARLDAEVVTKTTEADTKGLLRELAKVPKREQTETLATGSGVGSHLANILRKE